MRARYYSPELRRFVNADIVAGSIDSAVTLNRFAYANGNPVSLVDLFGLSAERAISINKDEPYLLVLYDMDDFARQAEDERKYLMEAYGYEQVVTIPINNDEEFIDIWNQYVPAADGVSLVFHGTPHQISIGSNIKKNDIAELNKADLNFLRLLTCNGGHKDVFDNIANALKANHDISSLYAMDGSISYYPRNWYLFGHDYSKYNPRLSYKQDGFYKYARNVLQFIGPNVGTGYMNTKRKPDGLYLVE